VHLNSEKEFFLETLQMARSTSNDT
jgi:hypothetical protein